MVGFLFLSLVHASQSHANAEVLTFRGPIAARLFRPGHQLFFGIHLGDPLFIPIEGSEHLFLVHGPGHGVEGDPHNLWSPRRAVQIKHLQQFKGFVKINSSDKALEFVRLRTGNRMWFAWSTPDENAIEVTPTDASYGDGIDGLVNQPDAVAIAKQYPVIEPHGRHFRITRLVMVRDKESTSRKCHVEEITEDIGPQGEYQLISSDPVVGPDWFVNIKWRFPTFH